MCMSRLSSLCGDITRALDYNPGPPFATRRDAMAPSPQDFESSSRPALSSIHTASVDRRCAGQLALHTASTVHSYWTTSLGPSGLEHASESESEVTEVPQIHRLRTLKMCASGFAFMWDGSLPQQWAWFNWSKVFRVRVSVHATIRVHRAAVPFFFALLFAT
ncbi:hypothetical protein BC826DRAFT_1027185 [Russula brevipes]|nr:hypothetical protein BC826DRAFT_1040540 [Russula brevipes]KAI0290355.1 hypothetical protein BC826DRAFT_1027185 [Russula brevipes]